MKQSPQNKPITSFLIYFVLLISGVIYAQQHENISTLTFENTEEFVWLTANWNTLYLEGNHLEPADIDFSSSVKLTSDSLFYNLPENWKGEIWAYKDIIIDSSLINTPLSFSLYQSGYLKLYIDSRTPIEFGYNDKGELSIAHTVSFNSEGIHRLLIEFEDPDYVTHLNAGFIAGFYLNISKPENAFTYYHDTQLFDKSFQMFFTAFILAFALLHLVLYIYLPELKGNLYFLLFLLAYAVNTYFDFEGFLSNHVSHTLTILRIHRGAMPFVTIFALRFLYSLFYPKPPRHYWIITAIILISGAFAVYAPISNFWLLNVALLLGMADIFRILFVAYKKKFEGARIITLGFVLLFLFSAYDMLNDWDIVGSIGMLTNAYMFGAAGLIICISIYLAKVFALANRRLAEEETQRLLLETDNKRKTWEIEEARKLQLSLLPQCGEELLGYDVCFQMRTANEVGGDYYDYMITNDNTLTIVVGDATGHGMKAGNMVVLIKSLFNTMGHTFYIPDFFNHCTRQIKRMNFGNLFMSMTMLKLRNNNIVISTAGMPQTLIYKNETETVKEILIKGMPLGAHDQFPYREEIDTLQSGDIILLISDGITELFNKTKKMFGIEKVKVILKHNHTLKPAQIVDKIFAACDNWRGSHAQDDDITIVVLKRK